MIRNKIVSSFPYPLFGQEKENVRQNEIFISIFGTDPTSDTEACTFISFPVPMWSLRLCIYRDSDDTWHTSLSELDDSVWTSWQPKFHSMDEEV